VVVLETVGTGRITYECRSQKSAGDVRWEMIESEATLTDGRGARVGRAFGPPATWQSIDGSLVTGVVIAAAPNEADNVPLQLAKANPATGSGFMARITFIQRVATRGGVEPAQECSASRVGRREPSAYRAGFVFYRAK